LTGYAKDKISKFEEIRNYQISHVFGRTKNVYAFTAPWNIVYLPKIIDPFTGHEAKGDMVNEYTALFQKKIYIYFEKLIDQFNEIMNDAVLKNRIESSLEELSIDSRFNDKALVQLRKSISREFKPIEILI